MAKDTDKETGISLNCGWGRLIFGHTFQKLENVAEALKAEKEGQRDIAMYVNDPHIILAHAPQDLFLDPSFTFRINFENYQPNEDLSNDAYVVGEVETREELNDINRIYNAVGMVPIDADCVWKQREDPRLIYLVARHPGTRHIVGVTNGVDHVAAFGDIQNGSSLWALAVDPQSNIPSVGEALTRYLIEHYQRLGRSSLDLSVIHDNNLAMKLYARLGFEKIPVWVIKRRNPINEKFFVDDHPKKDYNPYATIIIEEALRRGIAVDPLDPMRGYFRLTFGGRSIDCWESLTEMTSAIAMTRCDDKEITRSILEQAKLRVPAQIHASDRKTNNRFLNIHKHLVVKPARGEQGQGISVDITTPDELSAAIKDARKYCDTVLLEEYYQGHDLRVIVINNEVVAAAIRRPASIVGTGRHSIRKLIEKQSRKREATTGGESKIPMDAETERCVRLADYSMEDILPEGIELQVRKTANLHTGGTIHDVTADLHPEIASAALQGAQAIGIPVTGLDFMVKSPSEPDYIIIEANERPGLANHEPQPTAEKFIDMLFPQTNRLQPAGSQAEQPE